MDKGLGDPEYLLAVYIGNRPPIADYEHLKSVRPVALGEITHIVNQCGNHWRKIFNIYAKLMFQLRSKELHGHASWQDYRDHTLLQEGSGEALLFDERLDMNSIAQSSLISKKAIRLISGKQHAEQLLLGQSLEWLDQHFAVVKDASIIVTPYFDYRQLSNARLEKLVNLIQAMK